MFRSILFSVSLLLPVLLTAQTKIIAHKSHSGTAATFVMDGPDNFGLSPEMQQQMEEQSRKKDKKKKENQSETQPETQPEVPKENPANPPVNTDEKQTADPQQEKTVPAEKPQPSRKVKTTPKQLNKKSSPEDGNHEAEKRNEAAPEAAYIAPLPDHHPPGGGGILLLCITVLVVAPSVLLLSGVLKPAKAGV